MQTPRGQSIEDASMEVIESEIGDHPYDELQWQIVRRIIHSTADFDFARDNAVLFHVDAISGGIDALRRGCNIIIDVNGVGGLLNKQNLKDFGNDVICRISDDDVIAHAKKHGGTRARAAMRLSGEMMQGGLVVIGNAPTALLEVAGMINAGVRPALVVGIPVGFISAAESKEALSRMDVPFITNRGRKGGSPAAAAIVNALFKILRVSASRP